MQYKLTARDARCGTEQGQLVSHFMQAFLIMTPQSCCQHCLQHKLRDLVLHAVAGWQGMSIPGMNVCRVTSGQGYCVVVFAAAVWSCHHTLPLDVTSIQVCYCM